MNRFFLAIMISLVLMAASASADTTWVSTGNVSGTWSAAGSPYMILSDVQVAERDTLIITSGVRVYFTDLFRIVVNGRFKAEGSDAGGIVFTTDTTVNQRGWGGIWLMQAEGVAQFNYCTLEHGRAMGVGDYGIGGAVLCDGSSAEFNKSIIQFCKAGSGHGIFIRNRSTVTIRDCILRDNGWLSGSGGAICCRTQSNLTLERTTINDNSALYGGGIVLDASTAAIYNSRIQKNSAGIFGGGLYCSSGATLTMSDSWLMANTSVGGGGLDGRPNLTLTMNHCLIILNSAIRQGAEGPGGGLALLAGEQHVNNCTFFGNSASAGGGIYAGGQTFTDNCIFADHALGGAIYYAQSGGTTRYSCFSQNDGENFRGSGVPTGIGRLSRINGNQDSCDAYQNIFQNPMFNDTLVEYYHLAEGSPCINAGDPAVAHDPDGSVSDMGAFPYSAPTAVDPNRGHAAPISFSLTAYPNPFNAVTTIPFELARSGHVSLRVYDLLGQEVAVLVNGALPQGSHSVQWDAVLQPSGTYLVVLESAGAQQVQKLLLLK